MKKLNKSSYSVRNRRHLLPIPNAIIQELTNNETTQGSNSDSGAEMESSNQHDADETPHLPIAPLAKPDNTHDDGEYRTRYGRISRKVDRYQAL